jgi:heme o synthase
MKSESAPTDTVAEKSALLASLREYFELTKPRVVALIVFTAVVGMFLATPGMVPIEILVFATIGIGLAAGSAACINHILDQHVDGIMQRTKKRPLPMGQLSTRQAAIFSVITGLIAMVILVWKVNLLTTVLTFASLVAYSIIYTMYLKRATPQNIVIGGAAGAAPPVLGWTAVTGEISADALLLFLIIFVWTPPHFWALALYRELDYAKVGIPMLPVTHGNDFTRLHILLYTVVLFAVTIMPFATKMSGWFYLIGMIPLNVVFVYYAWKLYRQYSDQLARRTFTYSIQYLALIFGLLLLDHYVIFITEALQSAFY